MPILREDKGRDYRRYEHTGPERRRLDQAGFTPVLSSNVSAIGEHDGDLYIRFHGGSSYVYPGSGDLYVPMLQSSSKGRFVWNQLRRKNVPYRRIPNVILPKDVPSTDLMLPEATMEVSNEVFNELLAANQNIVREMQRSFIEPNDVKTLITEQGIFTRGNVANRARTLGMIYDNQNVLRNALLATIV